MMRTVAAIVCGFVLGACIGGAPPPPQSAGPVATSMSGCRTATDVEAVLREFARAFSAGDEIALGEALSPQLQWYSATIPARGHTVSYGRSAALSHFQERHRAGDRLEFRRATVNALEGWDGAAHFGPVEFALLSTDGQHVLDGKGALFCTGAQRGVKVLSLYSR